MLKYTASIGFLLVEYLCEVSITSVILNSKVGRYWGILYHDILAGQYCDMTIY